MADVIHNHRSAYSTYASMSQPVQRHLNRSQPQSEMPTPQVGLMHSQLQSFSQTSSGYHINSLEGQVVKKAVELKKNQAERSGVAPLFGFSVSSEGKPKLLNVTTDFGPQKKLSSVGSAKATECFR